MKWAYAFLVLMVVTAALYLYFDDDYQPPNSKIPNEVLSVTTPQAVTPQSMPPSKAIPSSTPEIKNKNYIEMVTNQPDAIYFEFDKNQAVFFDDIILGEVRDTEGKNAGLAPAPRVQLWNLPIAYGISKELSSPERVEQAIAFFNKNTPVKFVAYTGQSEAILFVESDDHCRSYLGRSGGIQPIYLSKGCGNHEIMHEIMHALGFIHEQSRTDRDQYIDIFWENILQSKIPQFQKIPDVMMEAMNGTSFDFNSIMLYKPNAFSKNPRQPTMKSNSGIEIAPVKEGLSPIDLERLSRLYGYR